MTQLHHYPACEICGMPGHNRNHCALKEHYHRQALRAVASGRADQETIREANRPLNAEQARNILR
jgi:hypothetical protein